MTKRRAAKTVCKLQLVGIHRASTPERARSSFSDGLINAIAVVVSGSVKIGLCLHASENEAEGWINRLGRREEEDGVGRKGEE